MRQPLNGFRLILRCAKKGGCWSLGAGSRSLSEDASRQGLNLSLDQADVRNAGRERSFATLNGRDCSSPALLPMRIALLWHSLSSGNLGIGALTLSNVALLSEVGREQGIELQFTIIGMEEGEAEISIENQVDSLGIHTRSLFSPSGVFSRLRKCHCIIDINAGDSFTDVYGGKRFAFIILTKLIALVLRKPLIFAPQTIGPFRSRFARYLAAFVLRKSKCVVTRDAASLALVRELAPSVSAVQSIDVSFAMPYNDRSNERGGCRFRIGLNVSGLLFRNAETGANRFGLTYNYAEFSRSLISRLLLIEDVDIYLFCHTVSRKNSPDDDRRVADLLSHEFEDVVRVPDFDSPISAKSFISSMDFVVSARMHACIAALASGTAVVPVAYSRKFSGVFSALGYSRLLPPVGYDVQGAVEFVVGALRDREGLANTAASIETEQLIGRYREVLREQLVGVARKLRGNRPLGQL